MKGLTDILRGNYKLIIYTIIIFTIVLVTIAIFDPPSGRPSYSVNDLQYVNLMEFKSAESPHNRIQAISETIRGFHEDDGSVYLIGNVTFAKSASYSIGSTIQMQSNSQPQVCFMTYNEINSLKTYLDTSNRREDSIKLAKVPVFGGIDLTSSDRIKKIKSKKLTIDSKIGDVNFSLEDSMKVNCSYKGLLVISHKVYDTLIREIQVQAFAGKVPRTQKDTMKLAKRIYASLQPASSSDFALVRADLDSIKNIDLDRRDYIAWEWIVTPQKVGVNNLVLKLSRVDPTSGDFDKFLPAKIIPITVYAIQETTSEKITSFLKDEWKWLTAGFFALAGWFLAYKQNRAKTKAEQSKAENTITSAVNNSKKLQKQTNRKGKKK